MNEIFYSERMSQLLIHNNTQHNFMMSAAMIRDILSVIAISIKLCITMISDILIVINEIK